MNKKLYQLLFLFFFSFGISAELSAQFTLTGQLRTRTEYRDGLANLVAIGSMPAVFTSQRTRLAFGYKWDRLAFGLTVQDVRVWGADASTISNADGNRLMLHEGWAELTLFNKADTTIKARGIDLMTLKIGRQELIYDDVRLIGNLDWLQQARRHDMALLKAVHRGWQVDLGLALNQNTDNFNTTSTNYVPANLPSYVKNSKGTLVPTPGGMIPLATGASGANNNSNSAKNGNAVWINAPSTNGGNQDYKWFNSLYISKKFNQTKVSALYFNDNFGKYRLDSAGNATDGYVYGRRFVSTGVTDAFDYSGTNSRYTYGLMINHTLGNASGSGKWALQGAYYQQTGKNRDGANMSAMHYALSATYQKGKFSVTPGYEFLSGNKASTADDEKFDPLYGTPHRHWGFMDYFYVGTGSPAGGLTNPYFKVKYTGNTLSIGVDYHIFSINEAMKKGDGTEIDKQLGTEIDLLVNYNMNKFTNVEFGYSLMNATSSMPFAKGQATTDVVADGFRKQGQWLYLMLRFTPDFFYSKPVAIKQ
jgi:hypothetical protein